MIPARCEARPNAAALTQARRAEAKQPDQPADRIQYVRSSGRRQLLPGAGACGHAGNQPGPSPQSGLHVARRVTNHSQLADRAATEPEQGGQRQVRPWPPAAGPGQTCR